MSAYQLDFDDAWDLALQRESAVEAETADPELAQKRAGTSSQSWQRLCWRDLNFGFFASLTRFAVVAIVFTLCPCYKFVVPGAAYAPTRNGMPKPFNRARAPLSSAAVVTMVTFMPFSLSTFA